MSRKKQRISTGGGESLTQNPFGALEGLEGLPAGPEDSPKVESSAAPAGAPEKTSKRGKKNTNRGRVDILSWAEHPGGLSGTAGCNFPGIGLPAKKELARKMQKACSIGVSVKDVRIEIQGDKREEVKRILIEAGFKPVFAGG